ncbi:polysaccharide pyruvyl transferase family protein [Brachybacterium paraconglomeratum]|uniref:polysaccharide pyruvyl transferase family protein n=1 Tax=Brachybacterium paraconglomeratum TaxID=173362 RepID=UPI0037C996D8
MTRIAVVGYFGWGNFGDQLFLDTVLRCRAELWPDVTEVMCLTTKNLGRHAVSGPLGAVERVLHTLRIARRADLLVHCGGSVFGDLSGVGVLRRRLPPSRVQALGVSIGPFPDATAQRNVVEHLRTFERVVVRDDSWSFLEGERSGTEAATSSPSGGAEQGGDLAALSPLIAPVPSDRRAGLVVCPSSAAGADVGRLAHQVLQAQRALQQRGAPSSVHLLALNGHPRSGDEKLLRELAGALRDQHVECGTSSFLDLGLERTVELLTSASLVMSQRLHGAIVAYLSGGRFLMLDHHPKCRAFVQHVSGSTALCAPVGAEDISTALSAALDPGQSLDREPQDYIGRARRTYFKDLTHV